MSLRHIEVFRAVMVTGSMTEAARQLHTSQPQISRLIAQLERITQFPLFSRKGSHLSLTLDGTHFYREVEKTYLGLTRLESVAASIRSFSSGQLSVAAMPRLAGGLLARSVAQFKRQYPDAMVSIQSGNAAAVHNWVQTGICDLGLAMLSEELPEVQVEPVHTMNCVAVVPQNHRLAGLRRLKPSDFANEPFISFPRGSRLREQIDGVFVHAGVSRQLLAEASLGSSICAMVGEGLGLSIVNPLAAHEEIGRGLSYCEFAPTIPVTIALLYPAIRVESRLVELFARYLREAIEREFSAVK